ncbi:Scr1 family TA system antitoxin-like transcriptional regulator [Streptosporangium canum]|uniref:Scr1 family TA system antitoxin-like transcriptional regulator n=1 Tax=Streptosporangium canum TaxID=324952 RepID=UPI00379896CA
MRADHTETSDESSARRLVGARLRRLRRGSGITARALGDAIHTSEARISRLERGHLPFGRDDLIGPLALYGVTDRYQQETMVTVALGERKPSWWDGQEVLLAETATLGLEEQTPDLIRTYQLHLIPPLRQTPEYAAAACQVSQYPPPPAAEVTEVSVKNLLRRQQSSPRSTTRSTPSRQTTEQRKVPPVKSSPTDGTKASAARIYAHMLGSADTFAADREAAAMLTSQFPSVRDVCRANRGFLLRTVRTMAEAGIDQFLDIGCGLPAAPNVHEVAREIHPDARVVYVDLDSTVVAHAQATMDQKGVATIAGDLRDPKTILDDPHVRAILDFSRPIGLITVGVMHFVQEDARPLVACLRDALVPGSYFSMTHACSDTMSEEEAVAGMAVYKQTSNPVNLRTRAEITELFDGFELLTPGIVLVADWRPVAGDIFPERAPECLAGVGKLPTR